MIKGVAAASRDAIPLSGQSRRVFKGHLLLLQPLCDDHLARRWKVFYMVSFLPFPCGNAVPRKVFHSLPKCVFIASVEMEEHISSDKDNDVIILCPQCVGEKRG